MHTVFFSFFYSFPYLLAFMTQATWADTTKNYIKLMQGDRTEAEQ